MLLPLALIVLLAPSTKPATRPATMPAVDKPRPDEVVVSDDRHHFQFIVLKYWKSVDQKSPDRSLFVFQLPAIGDARKATPSFILTCDPLPDPSDDLSTISARARERIAKRNNDPKLETDQAATLAGHDGWTFEYSTTLTVTVIETNGPQHKEPVKVKVRDQVLLANGLVWEFVLTSDDRGMPIRSKQEDRVIASLKIGDAK